MQTATNSVQSVVLFGIIALIFSKKLNFLFTQIMFIDTAVISIKSGKGGDGSIHFRREKFVPRGGPDGGDGGKGGDVLLEVSPNLNTLSNFRYKDKFIADNGRNGAKNIKFNLSLTILL